MTKRLIVAALAVLSALTFTAPASASPHQAPAFGSWFGQHAVTRAPAFPGFSVAPRPAHKVVRRHKAAAHYAKIGQRHRLASRHPTHQLAAVEGDGGISFGPSFSPAGPLAEARRYIGETASQIGLPRSLWCADFVNFIEHRLGHSGTRSREAKSFLSYGPHLARPQAGAIAVLGRAGGGHVGYVEGVTARGDPIILSGNHGGAVRIGVYPANRVIAYVASQ